ncbi:dihydrolipoamide dehydrogenase (plasmid) [Rhodococcus opacus]|uniref:Dihydrolipoyl dehydrogenase n=1 Tax=Rhodococcus opacus TaxID=37919 RepID=A0A1B1KIG9_RHOOP|nr:dihydrolipoyl dehydrogenase [Rhodococcus opacus]ANS32319.1 dihydrolipoamide dehydrogenase [Rhodococcus opacus]ANS32411.1 dihydrolipoamide dehydrogenase [Rhodococcus opacus]
MSQHEVDVVVLGGGSGGYAAALRAAELGKSVVLIEKDRLGGTCLHKGCIPTKALLHAGEIADITRESHLFGIESQFNGIDVGGIHKYMHAVIDKNWKGLSGLIRSRGINVVESEGRLIGPRTVEAGNDTFSGTHVVLATGSQSRSLPGIEVDGEKILFSEHALNAARVPKSAIVLGGGVIGCEFASAWTSLGTEVTIVEALPHLVPLEDEASSKLLERAFRRRKIGFHLGSRVSEASKISAGVKVSLEDGTVLEAEVLLVAVGRSPVTEGLGYAEQGIEVDRGAVVVDEYCRTTAQGVYAVGDLIPTLQLAHVGFAEGILVAEHLAGLEPDPIRYEGVPRITYSSPEIASVGLTEEQAQTTHGADEIKTVTYDLSGNGRSAILKTQGAVKLVALLDGTVIGVHMVGDRVSELSAESQLIVNWEAMADDVASLIHPHPTQSEALGEAHLLLAGKPLHVH